MQAGAHPFWADGGQGAGPRSVCAPGRHLLAAYPTRVDRVQVEALPPRGLIAWLRERLPGRAEAGALTVVGLSYDAGRSLERIPVLAAKDAWLGGLPLVPDVVVARYPAYLEAESEHGPWRVRAETAEAGRRLLAAASEPAPAWAEPALPGVLASSMTREAHRAAILDVLEGIAAGDLYQANVARRLAASFDARDAPGLYVRLRRRNPPAFGILWALARDAWIASVSPECLLRYDAATREAHSYPIKGTRARGQDAQEDRALVDELERDPKERAEHVMIVDLVRNDLGRVAKAGSVSVPVLAGVETLPTVHHLVSDVRARVRVDCDLVDVIGALFPGGSVTGAPKIAAMARIERVEGLRRGFYTGSVGVVEGDGRATFNILIRTAVVAGGRLSYHTGGGIVAQSDPEREWRETELKALALVDVLRTGARPEPAGG